MNARKFVLCLCLLVVTFFSYYSDLNAAPRSKVRAKAAILMNISSGSILYAKNSNKPIQPASLTKILSLYLVYEAITQGRIHLKDMVKISTDAQLTEGSSMYLVDETEVGLEDLIKGMAVVSANDASVAVAEHIGGSVRGFMDMMNAKAQKLGMKNSHFINPTGLPAKGQVTTARDILKLSAAYIRDFPEALQLHSLPEYTYRDITQPNSNTLLKKCGDVDGLKTGFIRASGFHLVATAKRGNTRLIAVVMGEKNPKIRESEAIKLLEQGFRTKGTKNKVSLSAKSHS